MEEVGRKVEEDHLPSSSGRESDPTSGQTAGMLPAKWVGLAKGSEPTVENEPVIELAGRIRGEKVAVLLDSGSTGNFVSDDLVHSLNMEVIQETPEDELTLADGSKLGTQGQVCFLLRRGDYKTKITARVFPQLHKQVILGTPWLVQENPAIDWRHGQVIIRQWGSDVLSPRVQSADEES